MTTPRPPHTSDNWTTTKVTALPTGWWIIYETHDTKERFYGRCIAILTQERRSRTTMWEEPKPDGSLAYRDRTQRLDKPYDTQTVFAECMDGYLEAAENTSGFIGVDFFEGDPNTTAAQETPNA